jgi:hydrogenase small subunit
MHSKLKILWIDAVGCNGCSHSFFNHPQIEAFFEFEILYHPLLDTPEFKIQESDILIIEGGIRDGFIRLGYDITELITALAKEAKNIIALGTCASFGGIYAKSIKEIVDKKIISIPGCPIHYEWLMYVLMMIKSNKKICLDELDRPIEIYSYTSHMGCTRNEYFEWKIDSKDFGEKEGCLFYLQGCQGPYTHSSCNKILWNEVNSKPRVGTPCFGCTEPTFPKINLFESETFMGLPANIPLGVNKRAYFTLAGVAKSLKNERLSKKLIECKDEDR